ncbi:hypothetical protein [Streptomyces sp. NPDC003036]|uniref:hypothetical protein n=1 Tax=Streptomyces sp. NPDC003036 TaxID=3154442 RepID=UPI0033A67843
MTFWHAAAEWHKSFWRPVTLFLVAVIAAGCVTTTFYAQMWWSGTLQTARSNAEYSESGASLAACKQLNPTPEGRDICERTAPLQRANDREQLALAETHTPKAAAAQTLPGAFGWAAQALGTAPGLVLMLTLAAVHTAGEWRRRTATGLLLADPDVRRHIAAKTLAVWSTVVATLVASGLSVYVFALLKGRRSYPLHELYLPRGAAWADAASMVAGALTIAAVWSLAAVSLAVATRSRARTLVYGGALLLALTWSSALPVWSWLPGGVLAEAMDVSSAWVMWNAWWPDPSPDAGAPFAVRAVLVSVAAGLACWWLVRRARTRAEAL